MASGGFGGGKSRKGSVKSKSGKMFQKNTAQAKAIKAARKSR
jgi:hypothetical protein